MKNALKQNNKNKLWFPKLNVIKYYMIVQSHKKLSTNKSNHTTSIIP